MKLKQWLYGLTALSMLAACSDKDLAPDLGGVEKGNGYVGISIQMPSVSSTRANSNNDNFDDGAASEYKLDDAVLVLFQGTTEATATSVGAFKLERSQLNASEGDGNQITTRVTRVANVTGVDLTENTNLYALVIANGAKNGLYPNGEIQETEWMKGKTIKKFQETLLSTISEEATLYNQTTHGSGFASNIVMTNSPLSEQRGGNKPVGQIQTALPVLVEINNTVWPSQAEALANPAGIIHIERAVGKITCSNFTSSTGVTVTIDDKHYALGVDLESLTWEMAQDLKDSYIVRNTNRDDVDNTGTRHWRWNFASSLVDPNDFTEPAGKYRMIGHDAIVAGGKDYYRPYFCQVPGYGKGKDANREDKTFNSTTMTGENAVAWSRNGAFYPHENTFPVEYMKYANTTRIGFWVNFKFMLANADGEPIDKNGNVIKDLVTNSKDIVYLDLTKDGSKVNFYTKGLDRTTIYLDDENGKDPLTNEVIASLTNNPTVKEAVEKAMKTDQELSYSDLYLGDLLDIQYNEEKRAKSGEIEITSINFRDIKDPIYQTTYEGLFNVAPEYDFSDDIDRFNLLDQVYEYTGGKVFYEVRIKHFGDDLTPWNKDAHLEAATIDESYGTDVDQRKEDYLGRYGIVRNNWYDLNVTTISKIGDPRDPALWDNSWPGKPDDNKDEYIAVELRVLSWAKRTQDVEF